MNEHPTAQELERYRERVLSPADFLAVHLHVGACIECSGKCETPRQLKKDYENLVAALMPAAGDAPDHLTAEEALGYVESRLGEIDLEIAESHLEFCDACQAQIQTLQAGNATGTHASAAGVAARIKAGRTRGSFLWPGWLSSRWMVAGGACLVALAVFMLLPHRSDQQRQSPIQVQTTGDGQAPRQDYLKHTEPPGPPSPPATVRRRQPVQSRRSRVERASGGTGEDVRHEALLVLQDSGRTVTVNGQGRLTGLEMLPAWLQREVGTALKTGSLARPAALAGLAGEPGTLRGATDAGVTFRLSSPSGQVVQSTRPVFRWQPLAGAASYTVTVVDAGLNVVADSGPLTSLEWTPGNPLEEGAVYSWQVAARKDEQLGTAATMAVAQAKFSILGGQMKDELRRARRSYDASHLAMGTLYVRAGLLDEAETEFRALLKANPRSDTARRLLRKVQTLKRGS